MRGIRFIPDGTHIHFIRLRPITLFLSALLVVVTMGGQMLKGLNWGIDFTGGTSVIIKTPGKADLEALRAQVRALDIGNIALQEFGSDREIRIRIEHKKEDKVSNASANESQTQAVEKIKQSLGADYEISGVEAVGPTVGQELISSGIWAVIWALIAMAVYIWLRFEWQFGVCALMALIHDCVSIVALYVFTGMEFNLDAIVAILITAGYSINDTVVIYDRIRENLRKYKAMPLKELIDKSINETLSRTVLTSGTTLIALISLYLFGGKVIANYSLPIICGIVVGTYSSIFLAAPLLTFFKLNVRSEKKELDRTA